MDSARDKIISNVRSIIDILTVRHSIKAAYIFGSQSKGSASIYSDVDIAIILKKIGDGSPFNEAFEIFHEVQKQNSLYEIVCFSEEEFLNEEEEVIKHIKKDGIKIY